MEKKERRHTSHLTADFKEFNRTKMSEIFGFEIDEESAWSVFKMIHRLPLYFLSDLDEKEVDSQGEKSIALPRVGKFRFRMTKAQKDGFDHEFYPRYKFYPSRAIETEMENIHGVADEESVRAFNKLRSSEERKLGIAVKNIQSLLKETYGVSECEEDTGSQSPECLDDLMVLFGKSLESIIESRVHDTIRSVVNSCEILKDDDSTKDLTSDQEDELEEDSYDEDEDEDDTKSDQQKTEEFEGDFIFGGTDMDFGEEEDEEEEVVIKIGSVDTNTLDKVEDFEFDFE